MTSYETENYNRSLYRSELFASRLCVASENVSLIDYQTDPQFHAAGLFGINQQKVFLADKIHERLYPASTTKILTLYLALKYGNLTDSVTISDTVMNSVPSDSSLAGLKEGEQLTLEDLLYGLMLPSGNDSAVAIAEHISGSTEEFVSLMNKEANLLGATNSHFTNPHGYHDVNHYTTAYDLYLILNKAIENPKFVEIISSPSYTAIIKEKDGSTIETKWKQTNLYVNGTRAVPERVTIIGGKTGTTDEAGSCLVLLEKDAADHPYISIIMGAASKADLYDHMTSLISTIPTLE